jgi:hypothetical protein
MPRGSPRLSTVIFASRELLCPKSLKTIGPGAGTRVLLEGSWGDLPPGLARHVSGGTRFLSLDENVGPEDGWLDAHAVAWSEQLASSPAKRCPLYLNTLGLRYHLLRLFRVVLFFEKHCPPRTGRRFTLVVDAARARPGGDHEDYVRILGQVCRRAGAELTVVRKTIVPEAGVRKNVVLKTGVDCFERASSRQTTTGASTMRAPSGNALWRRALADAIRAVEVVAAQGGRFAAWLSRHGSDSGDHQGNHRCVERPILLCGNPRLLDPVCHALLKKNARVSWLYERLAVKSWLRWRRRGVGQIVLNRPIGCNDSAHTTRASDAAPLALCESPANDTPTTRHEGSDGGDLAAPLPLTVDTTFRGIDLRRPIERWLLARVAERGAVQTRIVDRLGYELKRLRPRSIVLDQDLTPLARATVAVARELEIPTLVVQHGAFFCRLGAAGVVADRVLAWNEASRRQMIDWGVDRRRLLVTGPPHMAALARMAHFTRVADVTTARVSLYHKEDATARARRTDAVLAGRPRVLLLDTIPPRDERPDAVELALNSASYARLLRVVSTAVARVGAELIVKPHPRSTSRRGNHPVARMSRESDLLALLRQADAVLSIGSTAGMEAALAGWPVVQVFPSAARGVPRPEDWGLIGASDNPIVLERMLRRILRGEYLGRPRERSVVDPLTAADRIAAVAIDPPRHDTPERGIENFAEAEASYCRAASGKVGVA